MRELIPQLEEKPCLITGLPTRYLYNGSPIFLSFLTAANKVCEKYPEKNFDEALELVLSAQVYRNSFGEEAMEIENLKNNNLETITWKSKLKTLFKR